MNNIVRSFFLYVFTLTTLIGYSQVNQNQSSNSQVVGRNLSASDALITKKPFEKGLEGDPFLFDDWQKAQVFLKDGEKMFETEKLNYDIQNDRLKVLIGDGFVDLFGFNVTSFEIESPDGLREFRSGYDYKSLDSTPKTGFFEILYDGKSQLLERYFIYLKPATYNQALMIGEENDKIIIKSEFYYADAEGTILQLKKFKDVKKKFGSDLASKKFSMNRENLINFFSSNQL